MNRAGVQLLNSIAPSWTARRLQIGVRLFDGWSVGSGGSSDRGISEIRGIIQCKCIAAWSNPGGSTGSAAGSQQGRAYSSDVKKKSDIDVAAFDGLSYFNRRFGRVPTFEVVEIVSKDGTMREYGKPRTAEALGLHPRDVSIFTKDPRLTTQTATITVRDGAIFFKTEAASAIIGANKAILFKNKRERDTVRIRDAVLMSINQRTRLPFELCVLEVLLSETVHYFERKANHLSMMMDSLINDFAFDKGVVPAMLDGAQLLQPVQKHLTSVENDVTETYKAIKDLLEDDRSLSEICLTAQLAAETASHAHMGPYPPDPWGPSSPGAPPSNPTPGGTPTPGSSHPAPSNSHSTHKPPNPHSHSHPASHTHPHHNNAHPTSYAYSPPHSNSTAHHHSQHNAHPSTHTSSYDYPNPNVPIHPPPLHTPHQDPHTGQHNTPFHPRHQPGEDVPLRPMDRPPDTAQGGSIIGMTSPYHPGDQSLPLPQDPSQTDHTLLSVNSSRRHPLALNSQLGVGSRSYDKVNELSLEYNQSDAHRGSVPLRDGYLDMNETVHRVPGAAHIPSTRPKGPIHAPKGKTKRFGGMSYPSSRSFFDESWLDRDRHNVGVLGKPSYSNTSSSDSSTRHSDSHSVDVNADGYYRGDDGRGGMSSGHGGSSQEGCNGDGNGMFEGAGGLGRSRRPPGGHAGGGHVRPKDLLASHTHLASTMLEAYQREVQSLQGVLGEMDDHLCNTRETWHMQLDAVRNHIILVSLWLSLVNVSVMLAAILPAFLGMNLSSGLPEDSPLAFYTVCGASVVLAVASYPMGRRWYLRSFQDLANSQARQMKSIRLFMMQHIDDVEDIVAACQSLPSDAITRQDFRKAIKEGVKGRYISDAAIDFLYRCFDTNRDGLLQQAELVKSHSSHYSRPCGNGNHSQATYELEEPPRLPRALRWLYGPPKSSAQPPHDTPGC